MCGTSGVASHCTVVDSIVSTTMHGFVFKFARIASSASVYPVDEAAPLDNEACTSAWCSMEDVQERLTASAAWHDAPAIQRINNNAISKIQSQLR